MISKLSGILDSVSQDSLILDVGGVGYQVFCSQRTRTSCSQAGEPISLLIDTHVREDHIHLFGFRDTAEQAWFRLLISVQGVGAKAAMAILGACPPEQLSLAIISGDKALLTRAEGVGPKLATRILTELKDKAGKIDLSGLEQQKKSSLQENLPSSDPAIDNDAVSALVNLGYARSDAFSAVAQAKQKTNDNASLEDVIRLALKELSA